MKKSIDLKALTEKLKSILRIVKRYAPITLILIVAISYGATVWHIKALSASEPSEDTVTEALAQIKRPRIDPNVVSQIQNLQDTNVQVQAVFKAARDNPFQD